MNKRKYQRSLEEEFAANAKKRLRSEAEDSVVKNATSLPAPVILMVLSHVEGEVEIAEILKAIAVTFRIALQKAEMAKDSAETARLQQKRDFFWRRVAFEYFPTLLGGEAERVYKVAGYGDMVSALEKIIPALVLVPNDLSVHVKGNGAHDYWAAHYNPSSFFHGKRRKILKLEDYRKPFLLERPKSSGSEKFDWQTVRELVARSRPDYNEAAFENFQDLYNYTLADYPGWYEMYEFEIVVDANNFNLVNERFRMNSGSEASYATPFFPDGVDEIDGGDGEPQFVTIKEEGFTLIPVQEASEKFLAAETSDADVDELIQETEFDYTLSVSVDLRKITPYEAAILEKNTKSRVLEFYDEKYRPDMGYVPGFY